jgi:CheY-like chemotaxis protein
MGMSSILIVEDEGIVALDIQIQLTGLGHIIFGVVSSGKDAIERAASRAVDVVLMDIGLRGDMDGIEAARYIYQQFGTPVIYLTAYKDDMTLQRAMATHPAGYLVKPFEQRDLQMAIEAAIAAGRGDE